MTRYLVTGAAGFIGSNLVHELVRRGEQVVALDNLSTGKLANLEPCRTQIEFIEGDVRDLSLLRGLCARADFVLHQAALGSVPRSIADPCATNENNLNGTLNVFVAAKEAGVRRVVYASSSSVYGDTAVLPKVETMAPSPRSPYAVSKLASELYAAAFARVYGLETVGLRYFNVFGPRQDPDSAYAAVIPLFVKALMRGERPVIFGDGEQTRDFTYVDNAVSANLLACAAGPSAVGLAFNIGASARISLNELYRKLTELLGRRIEPRYAEPRAGDVRDSQADIALAQKHLGYEPKVGAFVGLERAISWYKQHLA